jgi:putative AdoMet-dependent methyltransferase
LLDEKGFDLWADGYESDVAMTDDNGSYPFAGYRRLMNAIYGKVMLKSRAKVLDIGIGTGVLAARLYAAGHDITGVDFSGEMLGICRAKMPGARLIRHDFSLGLPPEILSESYDFIIGTYSLHHLSDQAKIPFMRVLAGLLKPGGVILVGDVMFADRTRLDECREKSSGEFDDDEFYFVADELKTALGAGFNVKFEAFSHCSGSLTLSIQDGLKNLE